MAYVCYNTLPKLESPSKAWENRKRMAAATLPDELAVQSPFTRTLERYRRVFFALLVIPYLVSFNGQWRIGLDSAIYRGVAVSLAEGRGYTFGGIAQHQVYPGLPAILAGIDHLTGSRLIVPLILMTAAALLTLALIYRLLLTRVPRWAAVVVTCGVALNSQFVQQSQEMMTDTPFLLGMVAALYGWELLRAAPNKMSIARAMAVLLIGLALAASMRPTFWVLAIAWAGVCSWRVVFRRDQRAGLALAALIGVWLLLMTVDPRFTGMNFLKGRYEAEAYARLHDAGAALHENGWDVFNGRFTESFFNQPLYPFGIPLTILLLVGAALVTRRQPMWGLPIFLIFAVTLLMSDVPRYYMMVLPFMWLGFLMLLCRLLRKAHAKHRDWALFAAFSVVNFLNLAGVGKFIVEQRSGDFLAHYKDGSYVQVAEMARLIKEHVKPGEGVIGPYSSILTYLSGRTVLGERELLTIQPAVSQHPRLIANFNPAFVVGPTRAYVKKDRVMFRLFDRGVIGPGEWVARTPGTTYLWLARAVVFVPEGDWRDLPDTRARKEAAAARRKPPHAVTRPAVPPAATLPKVKKKRKTPAATAPATQPAKKKKKKKPTTVPTTMPAAVLVPFPAGLQLAHHFLLPLPWQDSVSQIISDSEFSRWKNECPTLVPQVGGTPQTCAGGDVSRAQVCGVPPTCGTEIYKRAILPKGRGSQSRTSISAVCARAIPLPFPSPTGFLSMTSTMNLRSGIPLIADLNALQADPLYAAHVAFNQQFLQTHGKALEGYGNHWGQNPFTMWSRRWEYPYVIQKVLDFAETQSDRPLRMLDGGSGVTYVPYYLAEKIPNLSVICCDTDTSYVPMFQAINQNTPHQRVSFQEAMLQKLPYDDKSLDVVACISVLEHTDNYGQIVTEFARVLRPGGLLVLTFDLSLDGKFTLSKKTAAELLETVERHFDVRDMQAEKELDRMDPTAPLLTTDYVKKTSPELLPWRYPMLKGVHDLIKGHGWTGGFRSKAVYCLDANRKG